MDVVVIGAGIVGASVAYRLAEAGVQVTVLERHRPAAGTTQTSFAWVNAHNKPPRPYHDLNAAGVAEHHRLAAELGGSWFHSTGCLQVAMDAAGRERLRGIVGRLRAWGYRAEAIDARRAHELEPDLALPEAGGAEFAFFADEGWIEAPVLVHALLDAAERAGATLLCPAEVSALTMADGRVNGIVTAAGALHADLVIDCTGRDCGRLLAPLGIVVERRRSPGLLVVTQPMPTCLARVVLTPDLNLRPDGAGRVLVQSEALDEGLKLDDGVEPDAKLAAGLVERAQALVPALTGAGVEALRLGWRAMPGDGFSAVGAIREIGGFYMVFSHSGITLGPLLGRLAAREVTTGGSEPLLAAFRPGRLVASNLVAG